MSKKKQAREGVDDLVMLPKIAEDAIVENLRKRYMSDAIYTNIGPVLISVNPFKNLGISGEEYVEMYRAKLAHELPPHIYALAEAAYRNMKDYHENQCVIISGESGAGKTEASKLIMQYISSVSGKSEKVEYVKHVILESNPLLEAFGNAKTLRNNNSSRFGKYFEIQFDKFGDPCGGRITNYLLEKSRVVFQTQGERSFHVFYQLLAGANAQEQQELGLALPENYHYLNQSGCYTVDGISDQQDYREMRNAMSIIGLSDEEQSNIFKIIAGILHLGNVTFEVQGNGCVLADENALDWASALLQVDATTLANSLMMRVINTSAGGVRKTTYHVPQNADQAASARDSLSKTIYDRLFSWLVERVNAALSLYQAPYENVIGILDIFGFEIFERNGFEQFCINFVNEKLQQYFIELTLKAEQEEYVKEGIKWEPIKYFNNQIVCDLIEGKAPPGLFSILDDVCSTMHAQTQGADQKFLEKMNSLFGSHPHFRPVNGAFVVKHYAGDVTYEIEGFTEKNKDTLFEDIIEAIQCSTFTFLASLFPDQVGALQKKRPTTAGFKIKNSAADLMKALSACNPHYIRCIKPNETKKARDFEQPRVRHQVQYLGLLENIKVRRAGFAYRAPFERFLKRYKKLSPKTWGLWGEWTADPKEGARTILQDLEMEQNQWQMGASKVFIRHPESLFHLEELLDRRDYDCTVMIQKAFRNWKSKRHALEQRAWAADMFKNKKERRRASVDRKWVSDYMNYENNALLQTVMGPYSKERMIFCDTVNKINRRGKSEKRDLVITDQALYIITRQVKKKEVFCVLTRRVLLRDIKALSLSSLADDFFVVHIPTDYDNLFENDKKTEIVTLLSEYYKLLTGSALQVTFNDTIGYSLKKQQKRELLFQKNEQAVNPLVKSGAKGLIVQIATGLPRDTDTTPRNYQQALASFNNATGGTPTKNVGAGAGRGRGNGAPSSSAGRGRGLPQPNGSNNNNAVALPNLPPPPLANLPLPPPISNLPPPPLALQEESVVPQMLPISSTPTPGRGRGLPQPPGLVLPQPGGLGRGTKPPSNVDNGESAVPQMLPISSTPTPGRGRGLPQPTATAPPQLNGAPKLSNAGRGQAGGSVGRNTPNPVAGNELRRATSGSTVPNPSNPSAANPSNPSAANPSSVGRGRGRGLPSPVVSNPSDNPPPNPVVNPPSSNNGVASVGRGRGTNTAAPSRSLPQPQKPIPVPQPRRPTAKALYDYDAVNPDELSFKEGDIIYVLQKPDGGWWEGEKNGVKGWLPSNYITLL